MSKYKVTFHSMAGANNTLVFEADHVSYPGGLIEFVSKKSQADVSVVVAVFLATNVVSIVRVDPDVDDKVDPYPPKPVTLSRKHSVYAYGKGDLMEALERAISLTTRGGQNNTNYLRDIIRDLHKGS